MIFTPRRVLAATAIAIAAAAASAVPAAANHGPQPTIYCQYRVVSGGIPIAVMSDHFKEQGGNIIRGWLHDDTLVYAGKDGTATGSGYTWRRVISPNVGWAVSQYLQKTSAQCFS